MIQLRILKQTFLLSGEKVHLRPESLPILARVGYPSLPRADLSVINRSQGR